jgi:hypothetical protein
MVILLLLRYTELYRYGGIYTANVYFLHMYDGIHNANVYSRVILYWYQIYLYMYI